MTLKKAQIRLNENYQRAINAEHVKNKVAWALYQTWCESEIDDAESAGDECDKIQDGQKAL